MKTKSLQASLTLGMGLVMLISILLGCTPGMERQIQTAAAGSGATLAVGLQTQAVISGQTAVAAGVNYIETQAVQLQKTGAARIQTESVRALTEVVQMLPTTRTQSAVPLATPSGGKLPVLDYFAIGDSIASGHGLSHETVSNCKRSVKSYPYKLKVLLEQRYQKVNFEHWACSGATAERPKDDILKESKYKWFRNQVDEILPKLSSRPTLITITIGANDLHWSDLGNLIVRANQTPPPYYEWLEQVRASVGGELLAQIARLTQGRPNVSILVTEVFNPLNKKNSLIQKAGCIDVTGVITCYERLNWAASQLSNAYVLDVWVGLGRPAWMRVVPIQAMFSGHESPRPKCGDDLPDTATTWVQYPGQPGVNGEVPPLLQVITGEKYGDCFHPNEQGAEAIAKRAYEYVTAVGK